MMGHCHRGTRKHLKQTLVRGAGDGDSDSDGGGGHQHVILLRTYAFSSYISEDASPDKKGTFSPVTVYTKL